VASRSYSAARDFGVDLAFAARQHQLGRRFVDRLFLGRWVDAITFRKPEQNSARRPT
jgi:hypothetical protein